MPCARCMYPPAIGLPMSIASRYAKRSRSRSKRRAIFARISARWFPVMRGHGPWSNAKRAVRTAASTSSSDASATLVSGSFVNGLVTWNDLPVEPFFHVPPMSIGRGPGSIQRGSTFTISHAPLIERRRAPKLRWLAVRESLGEVRRRLDADPGPGGWAQHAALDRLRRDAGAADEVRDKVVDTGAHLEEGERRRAGGGVQVRGETHRRRGRMRRQAHTARRREGGDAAQLAHAAADRGVGLPH